MNPFKCKAPAAREVGHVCHDLGAQVALKLTTQNRCIVAELLYMR